MPKPNKARFSYDSIIAISAAAALIVSLFLGYLLQSTLSQIDKNFLIGKISDFFFVIAEALFFFLVAKFFFDRYNKSQEEAKQQLFLDEITRIHLQYAEELTYMDVESGLRLAIEKICSSTEHILVIGTAKTELLNASTNRNLVINDYMAATEKAIEHNKIAYLRITKYNASNELIDHLHACLKKGQKSKKVRVIVMDEFMTANTFLVIDDKFLFISPTAVGSDLEISKKCHVTTNKEIIMIYKDHFNRIYQKAQEQFYEFTDASEFTRDKNSKLREFIELFRKTDLLRSSLNKFSKDGLKWQLKYSKTFLEDIISRVAAMNNDVFVARHNEIFSDLHFLTASFIDELKENDEYTTISFPPFWSELDANKSLFVYKTSQAIALGAKISRLLIVDWRQASNKSYRKSVNTALELNLDWLENAKGNYRFKILILDSNEVKTDIKLPFSFAKIRIKNELLSRNDYWILVPDNENDPKSTEVYHNSNSDAYALLGAKIAKTEKFYHDLLLEQSNGENRLHEFIKEFDLSPRIKLKWKQIFTD